MTPPNTQDFGNEIKNPFYPVTSETYGAYAITCISAIIFLAGIAGNIAILCIVCQNYYMKSISNSLLANLAVWDFALIFFCLPLVIFHELTKSWLLGEFTCKVVPYVEVANNTILFYSLLLCIFPILKHFCVIFTNSVDLYICGYSVVITLFRLVHHNREKVIVPVKILCHCNNTAL